MTSMWNPPVGQPTLTVIDLLEKHKATGGFKLTTVEEAVHYIARTMGPGSSSSSDLEMISNYMARDGAAWVKGLNFQCRKFDNMIKELELTARPANGRHGVPCGLLVLSTSKSNLPIADQMEKLKKAGLLALKYLSVDQNRAFLAIHDDTDHLHLHIIYSRYDSSGRLTEREAGKFRRYLLEDVTARIAFDLSYRLEAGTNTLPNELGDLVDIVSGQIVRDTAFDPQLDGCKARNAERRKARTGHPLEAVALAAYQLAGDDLGFFRALLAQEGIRYVDSGIEKAGGGAVFIDNRGIRHKASKVNHKFSRGRICKGAYRRQVPAESEALTQLLAEYLESLEEPRVATGSDAPTYTKADGLTDGQRIEANRRVRRGYSDRQPGRPRARVLEEDWPRGFPCGGIIAPTTRGSAFEKGGIASRDRGYHVELWREQRLIAVQKSTQIVVYSREREDLRALLLAAHEQWGSVEVTGNTKFKNRVADLAAEMNIPITNSELKGRIARRRMDLIARDLVKLPSSSFDGGQLRRCGSRAPDDLVTGKSETGTRAASILDAGSPKAAESAGASPEQNVTSSTACGASVPTVTSRMDRGPEFRDTDRAAGSANFNKTRAEGPGSPSKMDRPASLTELRKEAASNFSRVDGTPLNTGEDLASSPARDRPRDVLAESALPTASQTDSGARSNRTNLSAASMPVMDPKQPIATKATSHKLSEEKALQGISKRSGAMPRPDVTSWAPSSEDPVADRAKLMPPEIGPGLLRVWNSGKRFEIDKGWKPGEPPFLIPAKDAKALGITIDEQRAPAAQMILAKFFKMQDEEHAKIIGAVQTGVATIEQEKTETAVGVRYSVTSHDPEVMHLWKLLEDNINLFRALDYEACYGKRPADTVAVFTETIDSEASSLAGWLAVGPPPGTYDEPLPPGSSQVAASTAPAKSTLESKPGDVEASCADALMKKAEDQVKQVQEEKSKATHPPTSRPQTTSADDSVDEERASRSPADIPAQKMFPHMWDQGWRFAVEGSFSEQVVVFSKPASVPVNFRRWLTENQGHAAWFYSTQQKVLADQASNDLGRPELDKFRDGKFMPTDDRMQRVEPAADEAPDADATEMQQSTDRTPGEQPPQAANKVDLHLEAAKAAQANIQRGY